MQAVRNNASFTHQPRGSPLVEVNNQPNNKESTEVKRVGKALEH